MGQRFRTVCGGCAAVLATLLGASGLAWAGSPSRYEIMANTANHFGTTIQTVQITDTACGDCEFTTYNATIRGAQHSCRIRNEPAMHGWIEVRCEGE